MEVYPLGGGLGLWVFLVFLLPLVVLIVPWVFFLLNLRSVLWRVNPQNRAMSPDGVWLNFIPVFSLGWFIYTVAKVRDSVRAEYRSRGWAPAADSGYSVGLAAGILWICLAFLWWIPLLGLLVGIAWLTCWVIYWLTTSDLKHQLEVGPQWAGPGAPPPYWQPPWPRGPAAGPPPTRPPSAATGGSGRPQIKQCAACGATIARDDRFCRTCGLRLP